MPPRRLGSRLPPRRRALALAGALRAAPPSRSLNSAATHARHLRAEPAAAAGARRGPAAALVFVAEPDGAGAASATDRIVIKPNALQVTLLGDGRWVEAAARCTSATCSPARSPTPAGSAFVTTRPSGRCPTSPLMTDIDTLRGRVLPAGRRPARVVVAMTLTVVRDADGRLVASRRFTRTARGGRHRRPRLVAAFEAANGAVLREAVPWATAVMTGSPGA